MSHKLQKKKPSQDVTKEDVIEGRKGVIPLLSHRKEYTDSP